MNFVNVFEFSIPNRCVRYETGRAALFPYRGISSGQNIAAAIVSNAADVSAARYGLCNSLRS